MSDAEKERKARNKYMDGLVKAATLEWSSDRLADPPYPPPRRVVRPSSSALGLTVWPPEDVRSTPYVLNQLHPDFDPLAMLRYYAVTARGRKVSACLRLNGFDATLLFGPTTSQEFKRAEGAMRALGKWCQQNGHKPVIEGISPDIAQRFIAARLREKPPRPLSEVKEFREVFTKVWDAWLSREAEGVKHAFRHFGPVPFEPIENPWRQLETDPEWRLAHGRRKRPEGSPLKHVNPNSAAGRAEGPKATTQLKLKRALEDYLPWLKKFERDGVDMRNYSAIAASFKDHGVRTARERDWDAKGVNRLLGTLSSLGWKPK